MGAVVALAVAAGVLAWVLIGRGDDSESSATTPATTLPATPESATPAETITQPAIQTPRQLRVLAHVKGTPIYWAGPRNRTRLEVSQTSTGTVYVRYLPEGVAAGDVTPYLTVATYARPNAFEEVQSAAKNEGTQTIELPDGGVAVYDPRTPTNLHMAYPDQAFQVEVYDPTGTEAPSLVQSGAIRPVAG